VEQRPLGKDGWFGEVNEKEPSVSIVEERLVISGEPETPSSPPKTNCPIVVMADRVMVGGVE